jgi:hypothetical protein
MLVSVALFDSGIHADGRVCICEARNRDCLTAAQVLGDPENIRTLESKQISSEALMERRMIAHTTFLARIA